MKVISDTRHIHRVQIRGWGCRWASYKELTKVAGACGWHMRNKGGIEGDAGAMRTRGIGSKFGLFVDVTKVYVAYGWHMRTGEG